MQTQQMRELSMSADSDIDRIIDLSHIQIITKKPPLCEKGRFIFTRLRSTY